MVLYEVNMRFDSNSTESEEYINEFCACIEVYIIGPRGQLKGMTRWRLHEEGEPGMQYG
jgi:hypothetical protein